MNESHLTHCFQSCDSCACTDIGRNEGFFAAATMASSSFSTPLTSYLMSRYNMKPNAATNVNNIYSGMSSFAPVVGAFVADAFWGRFRTMLFGSLFGVIVSYYQASCHSLSIIRHLLAVVSTPMGKDFANPNDTCFGLRKNTSHVSLVQMVSLSFFFIF